MTLRVRTRNLGSGQAEAYFTADPAPALIAIHDHLPPGTKRARAIEGHGYYRRPPKSKRRVCLLHTSLDSVDEISVSATRAVIEEHVSREEVEAIKQSYLASEVGDAYWVAFDCELHVNIVLAVLRNLYSEGELPEHPSTL